MAKFKKRPIVVVVEAWQLGSTTDPVPKWFWAAAMTWPDLNSLKKEGDRVRIKTLDGTMVAHEGDWIVRGTQGELYPGKAEIFDEIFEEFDESESGSFAPGVMVGGTRVEPPGWMWILGFALARCDWALDEIRKPEVRSEIVAARKTMTDIVLAAEIDELLEETDDDGA
jgi:hypothetical protein